MSQNANEQVVKIVRDAAGENAEAFELLCVLELSFEPAPIGFLAFAFAFDPVRVNERGTGGKQRIDAGDNIFAMPANPVGESGDPHELIIMVNRYTEKRVQLRKRGRQFARARIVDDKLAAGGDNLIDQRLRVADLNEFVRLLVPSDVRAGVDLQIRLTA